MRKTLLFLFISAFFIATVVAAPKEIEKSVEAPFTRGVNFSGWLEFKDPDQLNPYYITKKDFQNVKDMGCDVVRLPIHFEQLSSGAPDYVVAPEIFRILDDVAKWANELQIYVIFDFHNNTASGTSTSNNIESIVMKVWSQVSKRYCNSGKYIVYEIYNEPHNIDKIKWGKIEQKVIQEIRKCDSQHYIIVGGAEWNSFEAMKSLPDFKDDKIIYTFHFYDPFLFTHQGASWTDLTRITNVPFPYDSKRMPKLPKNATNTEKYYLSADYNYSQKGTEKAVGSFFNQYVKFSKSRNAPVFCGEFGVYRVYADHDERANWYRIVTNLLDERGIAHASWDYYGDFGVFKKNSGDLFPQDLDRDVVEAMKLKVPKGKAKTWYENVKETNDYTIFSEDTITSIQINSYGCTVKMVNPEEEDFMINITAMNTWSSVIFDLRTPSDLLELRRDNYNLVLELKNDSNAAFSGSVWFQDAAVKTDYEWRMATSLTSDMVPCDGQWHKIVIPITKLSDQGAWDNKTQSWINGRSKFDWTDINKFVISNSESPYKGSMKLRKIYVEKAIE